MSTAGLGRLWHSRGRARQVIDQAGQGGQSTGWESSGGCSRAVQGRAGAGSAGQGRADLLKALQEGCFQLAAALREAVLACLHTSLVCLACIGQGHIHVHHSVENRPQHMQSRLQCMSFVHLPDALWTRLFVGTCQPDITLQEDIFCQLTGLPHASNPRGDSRARSLVLHLD